MKRLFIVLSVAAAVAVISCKDKDVDILQEKQTVVEEATTANPAAASFEASQVL